MADGGETAKFLKLFLQAEPSLRSYLLALTRSADRADEVFQEVSLALWESFGSYDLRYPFVNWAMGVARNHVARWRRSRARSAVWLSPEVEARLQATYAELEDELDGRRQALSHCLERLGERARQMIALRYEKAYTLKQIADLHSMTLNAANKALGKIRRALAECTEQVMRSGPSLSGGDAQ